MQSKAHMVKVKGHVGKGQGFQTKAGGLTTMSSFIFKLRYRSFSIK